MLITGTWGMWRRRDNRSGNYWIGSFGWGGRRLFVLPDFELVMGMNSGNYGKSPQELYRVTVQYS